MPRSDRDAGHTDALTRTLPASPAPAPMADRLPLARRTLLRGALLGAVASVATACGGGSDGQEGGDSLSDPRALQPLDPEIGHDEDGYQHQQGRHTLPPVQPRSNELLAQPTEGLSFRVRVAMGAELLASAPVRVLDIHGAQVDEGSTDADGVYASAQTGRRFLLAEARTAEGLLYGLEYNGGVKINPVIDVNLAGTLLYKVFQRLSVDTSQVEFVINDFLGLEYSTNLSDIDPFDTGLDQEALRQQARDSGLRVADYLDRLADAVVRMLDAEEGDEALAPTPALQGQALVRKATSACPPPPDFGPWAQEIPIEVGRELAEFWSAAGKAVLGMAFAKAMALTGTDFLEPGLNFILDRALPTDDPVQKALATMQVELSRIASKVDEIASMVSMAEHKRALDRVIGVFTEFNALIELIQERRRRHVGATTAEQDQLYKDYVLEQSRRLIVLYPRLMEAHQLFVGLGPVGNDGVLYRWCTVFRKKKYYTAVVEKQYNDLLDWYALWNARICNYLFDAYATVQQLGGQRDADQVALMREQLQRQTLAIERLRPQRLLSAKLFIDVQFQLAWVGGCNQPARLPEMVPEDVWYPRDVPWGPRDFKLGRLMRVQYDAPCVDSASALADASITDALVQAFEWRLPTKKNMDDSFGDYIKHGYLAEFNSPTRYFNWHAFAEHCAIPSVVCFFREDAPRTPLAVILRNDMGPRAVGSWIATWTFRAAQYDLGTLQSSYTALEYIGKNNPHYPVPHFFPVADVPVALQKTLLPWRVYEEQIGALRAGVH
ncbi:hypothetical protein [Comamonas flocculans]|uniref:DUF3160 domain-containing protein n=1 Tax=Comamonas flocculans TaxID=2597701 RepID=A0A5B8RUD5_9BURK|nr:hypothetical protein [Comamonas flocculans]QEA13100.1 hypothetical protein FOZ74_08675 [Comamonas flocculans]